VAQGNQKSCSDSDFVYLYETKGPAAISRLMGVALTNVHCRRRNMERKLGRRIVGPNGVSVAGKTRTPQHPGRLDLNVKDGVVIVASDCHYWPGVVTTAHRALLHYTKQWARKGTLKAVVMNGDVIDGATISRHPPQNWDEVPPLVQELEAASERLGEIFKACGNAKRFWTLGNHDSRLEARLAQMVPEVKGVKGMSLKDHFPEWLPCWSVWVNDNVVIRHRYKNGIHATHNNTLNSGVTIVTGHLHSLKVTPFSDYNGTRWGVDTGTLAEPYTEPFDYTEYQPVNWRSGFAVLTFKDGELLDPELVRVMDDGRVCFRGEVVRV